MRGLVDADDPRGVEPTDVLLAVLIDDTDADDNVRRPENTVPGAWATVESCDVAELLLDSLDAGGPFSRRVNGSREFPFAYGAELALSSRLGGGAAETWWPAAALVAGDQSGDAGGVRSQS